MADIANEEFNLGEAIGGYEQARADRDFYMNMINMGKTNKGAFMASPIAAYLYGVSNVKMASMRAKAQDIQDKRQAKKDADAAVQRAQAYGEKLRNNLFQVAKAANNGEISKGSAAALAGHLVREMGATPVDYDADNGLLTYNYNGDDYELDLNQGEFSKGQMNWYKLQLAKEAEERKRNQGQQAIDIRRKASLGKGTGTEKFTTLSSFNTTHKKVIDAIGRESRLNRLTKGQVQDFIEGVESLSPKDKEQMEDKVSELMNYATKKGWTFSSKMPAAAATESSYAGLSNEDFLKMMPK